MAFESWEYKTKVEDNERVSVPYSGSVAVHLEENLITNLYQASANDKLSVFHICKNPAITF